MPNPHYNYYPPAGQVIDASDSRVTWNGRAWMQNGRVYSVPSGHRLIGKPGTSMAGWVYDWQRHAWMDNAPSAAPAAPSRPPAAPSPPRFVPHAPVAPQPPAPAPIAPQPQPPAHAPEKEEVTIMEKHPHNALDALIKHPIAPLIGGVLVLAAQFTDEPAPPVIPQDLPEPVAKQWQMIFNQNQQRFQRRMDLYEQLGMVLLGYASTNAVLAALPAKKAA